MAESKRDNNKIPTIIALSNADGTTPINVTVHPTTHGLQISIGDTGSDLGGDHAIRDNSGIPVLMGVSSADGITPVAIYADPTTGELLIKTT